MTTLSVRELKDKHPREFEQEYEKWREHALDGAWWDSVYEIAKADAEPLGFRIDAIWFTGFGSQGDGACWEGSVDIVKFLAYQQAIDPRWHVVAALVEGRWMYSRVGVLRSGSYYHENTMHASYEFNLDVEDEAVVMSGPYMGAVVGTLYEAIGGDSTINELVDWVQEEARDYARGIYKHLEAEHEYLTSEEGFIESCEGNGVKFDVEEDEFGCVTVEEV